MRGTVYTTRNQRRSTWLSFIQVNYKNKQHKWLLWGDPHRAHIVDYRQINYHGHCQSIAVCRESKEFRNSNKMRTNLYLVYKRDIGTRKRERESSLPIVFGLVVGPTASKKSQKDKQTKQKTSGLDSTHCCLRGLFLRRLIEYLPPP